MRGLYCVKNLFITLLMFFFSLICCAKEYEFMLKGERIKLEFIDIPDILLKESKHDGSTFYKANEIEFHGRNLWIGRYVKPDGNVLIGTFDSKNENKPFLNVYKGFFIKHKENYYVCDVDTSREHISVSYLYRLYITGETIGASLVYKLPGYIKRYAILSDELIIYGGVNNKPFAMLVKDNDWAELRFVSENQDW